MKEKPCAFSSHSAGRKDFLRICEQEYFLCERRSSICIRRGTVFRKYDKYRNAEKLQREFAAAQRFFAMGIPAPEPIRYGLTDDKRPYVEFVYHEMKHLQNVKSFQKALPLFCSWQEIVEAASDDACGSDADAFYVEDLRFGLSFLPEREQAEAKRILHEVLHENEGHCVYVHGDMSLDNIGKDDRTGELLLYDYGNSAKFCRSWDMAYLFASIPSTWVPRPIPSSLAPMILLATAVKLGRGLRKQQEVEERRKIFRDWWEGA